MAKEKEPKETKAGSKRKATDEASGPATKRKPTGKKDKDADKENAESLILSYLRKQNRPYNSNDIVSNLHGAVPKTAAMKILATLADRGEIVGKTYGKQVIYAPRQDTSEKPSQEELDTMDNEISNLKELLNSAKEENKSLTHVLTGLNSSMTLAQLKDALIKVKAENARCEARLEILRKEENRVSSEDTAAINSKLEKARKEWRIRKRRAKNMLDAIMESSTEPPQEFFERIGVEDDASVNADPNRDLSHYIS